MRLVVLASLASLAVLALARPAHAGHGGILIPPVEVSIGASAPIGAASETVGPATEVLAGLHWASLAWKPTSFELGIGYVGSFRTVARTYATRGIAGDELRMHGGYLQMGRTLANRRHLRAWLAARGELLRADDGVRTFAALGAALRIASELYVSGSAGSNRAAVIGTLAVGWYVEATYRDVAHELGPLGLTAGFSVRLPFLIAGA